MSNTATEAAADIRARLADAGDAAAYAAEFTPDATYETVAAHAAEHLAQQQARPATWSQQPRRR